MNKIIYNSDLRIFSEEVSEQSPQSSEKNLTYRDKRLLKKYNKIFDRVNSGSEGYLERSKQSIHKAAQSVIKTPKSVARKAAIGASILGGPGLSMAVALEPKLKVNPESGSRFATKVSDSKLGTKLTDKLAKRNQKSDQAKLSAIQNKLTNRGIHINTVE